MAGGEPVSAKQGRCTGPDWEEVMSEEKAAASRRDFLKLATVAAPAVAAAAVTGTGEAKAAPAEASGEYRETEHVRKYLDSARF